MLNRWNEIESKNLSDVELLVYGSRLLGTDENLVLHGGGNTSVKVTEKDFRGRDVNVLRVKGSGSDLKTIEKKHFSGVRLEDILPLFEKEDMTDEAMVAYLAHTLMEPGSPRPSIETLLHGFIPFKAVFHSHADAILALTNNKKAEAHLKACFGEEILLVGYRRPGFLLSKEVGEAIKGSPNAQGIILLNHGLITWGESCKAAYDRHIELVSKAEAYLERHSRYQPEKNSSLPKLAVEERRKIAAQIAPTLRGLLSSPKPVLLRYLDSERALEFVNAKEVNQISQIGAATPDHLLNTKQKPLLIRGVDPSDAGGLKSSLEKSHADYVEAYKKYVQTHNAENHPMLDPNPRIILVPGIGIFTAGKDIKAAAVVSDIYEHTMGIIQKAEGLGGYKTLNEPQTFHAEYWPLELYKLTLAPPEKEVARKVAFLTGAGKGIGKSVAERFALEGAHLVLTDIDEAAVQSLAAEINQKFGPNRAIAVKVDVTSEAEIGQAYQQAILAYGGVDILFSNAGIAPTGAIDELPLKDWQKSLEINATGHFLAAREAVRIMKAQKTGGSIVFNVTKNVLAPGKDFGAYSCAKAAEAQLARILAIENGPHAIRVNMINPDAIFTDLWSPQMRADRAKAYGIKVEELENYYIQRNLLKVQVLAEDVAEAALYFASGRSAKTTGAILPVDGGAREAFPR